MRSALTLLVWFAGTSALTAGVHPSSQDPTKVGAANREASYRQGMAQRRGDYVAVQGRNDAERHERSAEREALAERLATMANEGQCRQAVMIARREGHLDIASALIRQCRLPDRPN